MVKAQGVAAAEAEVEAEVKGGTKQLMRRSENTRPCAPKSWEAMTLPRPLQRQHLHSSRHRRVTGRSPLHRMGRAASAAAEAAAAAAHLPVAAVWQLGLLVLSPTKRQRSVWAVAVVRVGR